jgi:hypothetical protein
MAETILKGSVLVLILFDVCEEIRLEELRQIPGAGTLAPILKTGAPELIRFARPPVVESLGASGHSVGEPEKGQVKYYDYGVVSVIFQLPFAGEWERLIELASQWIWESEFERQASAIARQKVERVQSALIKPYKDWLTEDYLVFQIREVSGRPSGTEVLSLYGTQIAQLVRGETLRLSEWERNEILKSSISYYANDLAVIGWNSAFVYDTEAGAQTTTELLEYANSQLLEFRHYDDLLTGELNGVYRSLEKGTGTLARWRLAREATHLQTVLLEVTELTERADNAIKFLRDMFSARFYRLAETQVGVPDYRNLVNQKLKTAEELYRFMVDQFHQGWAFVLELVVVVILMIELVYMFRGKVF